MFANTSTLSLYLGITFVVIAIIGSIAISVIILRSTDQAKLDKLIDILKWFVVSVAVVIGASIVSDSFKEREQDVKEIGVFDKYVTTITEADGIEKRWLLAEYFSFVAPPGELRDSWEAYKVAIKPALDEYRKDKAERDALASKQQRTPEENTKLTELQKKTETQEKSLVAKGEAGEMVPDEWLIIAATDDSLAAAQDQLRKAQTITPNAKIVKKGNSYITVIRSFMSGAEALSLLPRVKQAVRSDAFMIAAKDFCKSFSDNNEYLECS